MTGNPDSGKPNPHDTRDARFRLRAFLWDFDRAASFQLRVSSCGRKQVAGYVEVRASGDSAGLGGVSTCGSVWVCPVCSPKVAGRRSVEVQDTIRAWQARGGSVVLVTLTLSHSMEHRLVDTWDAITAGWKAVRNGRGWREDKTRHGIAGYARVIEVTHGKNGWHPHVHALLFLDRDTTEDSREQLRASIFGRWSTALADVGYQTLDFDATGKAVAVDVRHVDGQTASYVAEYLAKMGYTPRATAAGLAVEVARGDLKSGRKGSRTPWELLEAAEAGDTRAAALWAEWERASQGRRQYAWSQGFRASLDLDAVLSDVEAAEREDAALDVVALLPRPAWSELVKDLRRLRRLPGAPKMVRMLKAAATLSPEDFRAWLVSAGIEHVDPAAAAPAGGRVLLADDPTVARIRRQAQTRRQAARVTTGPDGRSRQGSIDTAALTCASVVGAPAVVLATRARRLPLV